MKRCCCCAFWFVLHYTVSAGLLCPQKINYQAVSTAAWDDGALQTEHRLSSEHAVDPDKRRILLPSGRPASLYWYWWVMAPSFDSLPRKWNDAVAKYTEMIHWCRMALYPKWFCKAALGRLTNAFKEKRPGKKPSLFCRWSVIILPMHMCLFMPASNHNGQLTGQTGIHGFWEAVYRS